MDDRHCDMWSRRRFGIATGGVATALLGFAFPDGATAGKKHKNRRKRCVKLLQPCQTGGRHCCHDNACQSFDTGADGTFFCCKPEGKPCQASGECCIGLACFKEVSSEVGFCKLF